VPFSPGVHFLTPTVPLHVFEASEPGPTALIQAGIHGDEVAGVHALEELLEAGIRPSRGRLLVCPTMNRPAYRVRQRAAPGGLDLNRCFPGDANAPERERRLARVFMDLVLDERPELMVTLHESQKRYDPEVTPSFGQTLVYGVDPIPPIVANAVARLDANRRSDAEAWASQYYPVSTSSTEVIVDAVGCVGICVETWMGFDERRRIDMQREVVRVLLDEIGILPFDAPLGPSSRA
jgi:predicted deacylase